MNQGPSHNGGISWALGTKHTLTSPHVSSTLLAGREAALQSTKQGGGHSEPMVQSLVGQSWEGSLVPLGQDTGCPAKDLSRQQGLKAKQQIHVTASVTVLVGSHSPSVLAHGCSVDCFPEPRAERGPAPPAEGQRQE